MEVLVVLEDLQPQGGDAPVAGEDQADRDLVLGDGRLGQRAARIEGLEALELQAVRALEAGLAERTGRALGRTTEDEVTLVTGEVGERGELVVGRELLGDGERVLVGRSRRGEQR